MKIIQINCVRNNGSTGKIVSQIHNSLDKKKVDNIIVYGSNEDLTDYSFCIYSKLGSHIHSFLSRKLSMQGRASWIATLRLLLFLKKEQPDIIHLHNIHGHYLNYKMLFKFMKREDIAVVWTFHDCWPFTGKCSHYSAINCMKWKNGCKDCGNLSTYPDSSYDGSHRDYIIKKKYFTGIERLFIVCNSEWLKSQVEQSFFKNKQIFRIYNGINQYIFKPTYDENVMKKYKIDSTKFIIIGVSGVWKLQKGLQTFIDLANKLDDRFQIVMVGVDNSAKKLLPVNITVIERTNNMQELAALYSLADVCLNASIEETFGLVTVESMACGTPVIVSNTTACPELVDKSTGIIVDMSNIFSILDAINSIKIKGKDYYKIACIKKANTDFTIEHMCNEYYELYKSVMEEKEV